MRPLEALDTAVSTADLLARVAWERLRTGIVFNPSRASLRADPYPFYKELRERDPVHPSWAAGGWVLTRHRDILAVLGDRAFSSDERNWKRHEGIRRSMLRAGLPDPYDSRLTSMLRIDPPDHTRLRTLVSQAFTPRAVERMRPRIQTVVVELLAGLAGKREFELVRDFASPLPVTIIAEMLGVPVADRERFRHWSNEATGLLGDGSNADRRRAVTSLDELAQYLEVEAEKRRGDPRDDLLSGLVAAEAAGDRLTKDELFATCILLLVAGNETTTKLVANGMLALLRHPEQLELLRAEPKRIPGAIEELLRYDSPVQLTSRMVMTDGELDGRPLRRGEQLVLVLAAGNRDPERFPDPDRLDVTRDDVRPLSFGHGVHFCLGAQLARLEARIAFEALLCGLPGLRLGDGPIEWGRNTVLRGPVALPVRIG
jgi:hypothetical protein